jgi:hypothetical protein
MIKFKIQTGKVTKEIEEVNIESALKRFFNGLNANQLGIMVSVTYVENKDTVTKLAPVEVSLQRLGLYSKFEKDIMALRANKKTTNKDVQNYDEVDDEE